jgi:hypothetical protein
MMTEIYNFYSMTGTLNIFLFNFAFVLWVLNGSKKIQDLNHVRSVCQIYSLHAVYVVLMPSDIPIPRDL